MPRRLAQQQMTLSDLEWPFQASRAISAVAELFISVILQTDAHKTDTDKNNIVFRQNR